MGKDYGPWVRHDWCPRCSKRTEQTRWLHRLFGGPSDHGEHRIQCNECASDLTKAAS
ncbi:hypothetical protein [Nocardioides sp. SYSU DS0651]|uniref:hypothetical protein n=1 Tax=Nocardioides sp. SYSU DS0651 TaxID=3415955 RepID=UPI003F4CA227